MNTKASVLILVHSAHSELLTESALPVILAAIIAQEEELENVWTLLQPFNVVLITVLNVKQLLSASNVDLDIL
jgi:hypothetical protein